VGFALLLGLLGLAAGAPWLKGGAPVPTLLTCQILLALGGGLIHARFDFPLQNPAVLLVVLLLLCCASCLSSYRSSGASRER
jgi:hypothetical protein